MKQEEIEKIIVQNSEQLTKLFEIASKQNGEYIKMNNDMTSHFKEDQDRFSKQDDDHARFDKTLKEIRDSLDNLQGVSDFVKGAGLLRRPLMLFVGLILAVVAVMGGLKTILSWFILSK